VAISTIEQRRPSFVCLQEEHIVDAGKLPPLDEPASDLERQIAE